MKKTKIWKIIGITLAGLLALTSILLITYFFIFILIRPFDNVITEGRPMMKTLCEMQHRCGNSRGPSHCSFNGQVHPKVDAEFKKWAGYKGCNESSRGYWESGSHGYLNISSCSCGPQLG